MKKLKRQQLILERVNESAPAQLLSTRELAREFAVSETTIRRDFQSLAADGLLLRQYGGAHTSRVAPAARQGQIGVLLLSRIDKYRDPFYNMVLEGVDKALDRLGYQLAFVKTLHEISTTAQAEHLLDAYAIQGIILLGAISTDSINYLRGHLAPIVSVHDQHELDDDLIMFDGERGMRMMVEHLAQSGRRRLGYVAGYADIRYAGFREGLEACGLDNDPRLHQILEPGPSGWAPDLGERGARNLIAGGLNPDAIVCASDRLAIGAMGWLQQRGYRVPDDIAVTGFDNIPDSQFTFPALTTVHVHKVLLGRLAAERLVRRIEDPDEVYLKITTPTALVIRHSCGDARRGI